MISGFCFGRAELSSFPMHASLDRRKTLAGQAEDAKSPFISSIKNRQLTPVAVSSDHWANMMAGPALCVYHGVSKVTKA